ncbi:EthD family reductase [Dyadobacter sp. LHD-138]|uniref:EthD family reductase n=1 Tax=Dyadobacter sp. LHD-138 TaxID=3071413 RepID=UPI0027E0495F|nr:EthD family reductase [Dyadobacter sp. LHD-138]MDQ6480932.1 EthD family reductase [Dyadobacter sp. LHD-138]
MFKVTVIYPHAAEDDFNVAYYLDVHTPLVKELLGPFGLVKVDVEIGVSGPAPGSEPPYKVICGIFFPDLQSLQDGLATEGGTLIGDIPNFTSVVPEMQISQVQ